MAKRLTMLLLLVFSIRALAQSSTNLPAMKGVVSDYAGKLDEAQIKELSGLLTDYERETSIEFVVVVANSLDGLSARNYATGIGDFWKIGKAGRDNGIVLLWAPNERAYALRVAEGLSADLPGFRCHTDHPAKSAAQFQKRRFLRRTEGNRSGNHATSWNHAMGRAATGAQAGCGARNTRPQAASGAGVAGRSPAPRGGSEAGRTGETTAE